MAHWRENRVSLLLSSCTIIAKGEQQLRAITSELRLQLRPVENGLRKIWALPKRHPTKHFYFNFHFNSIQVYLVFFPCECVVDSFYSELIILFSTKKPCLKIRAISSRGTEGTIKQSWLAIVQQPLSTKYDSSAAPASGGMKST